MKKLFIPAAMVMLLAAGCDKTPANAPATSSAQNSNSVAAAQQSATSNTSASAGASTQTNTQATTPATPDTDLHYSGEADAGSMNQPEVIGVDITAKGFNPEVVTINKGDFVQFTNQDSAGHQPVSDKGLFGANAILVTGKNYRFQFMSSGTFTYHDKTNSALTGTIVVK